MGMILRVVLGKKTPADEKGRSLSLKKHQGWFSAHSLRLSATCCVFRGNPMKNHASLPVAVIGAGPVGLAAAAHLLERQETPLVLETGNAAGDAIRQWAHVRMFSPWRYAIDAASRRLLQSTDWVEPDPGELPTGGDLVARYLEPLANGTTLRKHVRFGQRVIAITRRDTDKVRTTDRDARPFVIRTVAPDGSESEHLARAVIDASGTWNRPNPMGANGLPPLGETLVRDLIDYGIPDVIGSRRDDFSGQTVLVVGSGHSAFNAVLDLLALRHEVPDTRVVWAMRRTSPDKVFDGGGSDALPARGALGERARHAIESGALRVITPFLIRQLSRAEGNRILVSGEGAGQAQSVTVDRIIVATGFRPDLAMLRELRLELDPWLESPRALGPLIDPNLHSCGTVRPHGARELAHPEKDFHIVGMKSYGRAPTFLLATGYEQVRSVVAELAGDHEAATRVELDLPDSSTCSLSGDGGSVEACCGTTPKKAVPAESAKESAACCGGPAKADASACCVLDEQKKLEGEAGCGCTAGTNPDSSRHGASACCG
jgi:hypothetical protein